jgi:membrane protein required for colicin V production
MIGPLTYLDAALLAVAFISGLLAMYRGLTRELLSIVSWAVAGLSTLFFVLNYKQVAEDVATQMGAPVPVAQIAIGAVIFLIVLIVVHLITSRISDAVLDSRVGMIDRILGFVFGVARGFILIVIPYMFYSAFFPDESTQFPWVRSSLSLPYIKATGDTIRGTLETHMPTSLTGQGQASPAQEPQ